MKIYHGGHRGRRRSCRNDSIPGCAPCPLWFDVNLSQLVGALELDCQFPRIQILTDVCQSLLQLQQSLPNVLLIGERDVTPHGVGAAEMRVISRKARPPASSRGASSPYSSTRAAA